MTKHIISTPNAPAAVGPYSQGVIANGFVFTAGQIPLDPKTMALVAGDVKAQTRQVFANLQAVLEAAGTSLGRVVKTTVFLQDMNDFKDMNEIYTQFLPIDPPARSTVQVAKLPMGALVEIEVIALA